MVEARSIVEKVVKWRKDSMQHKERWEPNVAFTNIYGRPSEISGGCMKGDEML